MTGRWDDIEILRAIDGYQQETYGGGPLRGVDGLHLMERIAGSFVVDQQRIRGFVQELLIAADSALLTFKVQPDPRPNLPDADPNWFLQTISEFALTVAGQDRARGQVIVQPLPDPSEDDGRKLGNLILKKVAAAICEQYAQDESADLLRDEGIPPAELPLPAGTAEGDTHVVLSALWRWGSPGRRMVRHFLGRWLDDQLMTGPSPDLRAELIELLARQGWRVRESDSVLVIAEPIRGVPVNASFLRASRLHPLIESEARPQFLINKPDQGVFASMKAVEVRVRKLGGFGDDLYGVDLINKAFGPSGPLIDPTSGKGEREGMRMLFAGTYAVLRNPAGHREVDYRDISEAAEAVQTASLLMRILDGVEERLIAVGRDALDHLRP
jgi:uncharacterized protein (TIGR02391 family)